MTSPSSDAIVMLKWRNHIIPHLGISRNFWEPFLNMKMGAQWLSGECLTQDGEFEPHRCHCVVVLED